MEWTGEKIENACLRRELCSGWGKEGEVESGKICLKEGEDGTRGSKSTLPLLLLPQLKGESFPPPILGRRVPVGELWIFSSCACG